MDNCAAIIPAFRPCGKLICTIRSLKEHGFSHIVAVDDGSPPEHEEIFQEAAALGAVVLTHPVNLGKGRALKTGFEYILKNLPGFSAVSVDADGQHGAADAGRAGALAAAHPDALILGCRKFSGLKNMPLPNFLGNTLTRLFMLLLTGIWFSDTQCGLRAYPPAVMKRLLSLPGDRFEFESASLLLLRREGIPFVEFPVHVRYEPAGEYKTTFRRGRDSALIYGALLGFARGYALSFLAACVLFLLFSAYFPEAAPAIAGLCAVLCFSMASGPAGNKPLYFCAAAAAAATLGGLWHFWRDIPVQTLFMRLALPCFTAGYYIWKSAAFTKRPRAARLSA